MTITLSALYTRLRNSIGDEGESGVDQEYTDADLANYLAQAVTRYSAHVPHVLVQTQTTVADQSDYALPSNATGVRKAKWRYSRYVFPASLTPTFNAEFRDDALLMVRDQIIANFDRQTQTSWAVVNYAYSLTGGLYLRLFPTPTNTGDDIQIWYTTDHTLVGSAYPTIRAEHADFVADLAAVLILRREARILVRQPDTATGQGARVGSKAASVLLAEAQFLEQQVLDRLSEPAGGRG